MSQHHCIIRGHLKLRAEVGDEALILALRPLAELADLPIHELFSSSLTGDRDLLFDDIYIWCDGVGFSIDKLDELEETLGEIVSEPGWFELIDDDSGSDDKVQPYFVGRELADIVLTRAKYGMERAREFIEPYLGRDQFNSLVSNVTNLVSQSRGPSVHT